VSITDDVARGMALLDEERPGWEAQIDLDRLELASDCGCILGQIFASEIDDYYTSPYEKGLVTLDIDGPQKEADLGFYARPKPDAPDWLDWLGLEDEWVRQITRRRTPARTTTPRRDQTRGET
jgi:hypothetical protein